METASLVVIRCSAPDCEWGFSMANLGEVAFKICYSDFVEHCVDIHGLTTGIVSDAHVVFDLEKWTLTLLK